MIREIPLLRRKEVRLTPISKVSKRRKAIRTRQRSLNKILKTRKLVSQDYKVGKSAGDIVTALWKLQNNPQPVYVNRHRVHHGTVGLALMFGGALLESDTVIGFGEALARDDINDASEWFKFKKEPEYNIGYA